MANFAQTDLFGTDQPDLFGDEPVQSQQYQVNPQHIRNRFIEFMADMEGATTWPWDESRTEMLRELVWPYLFAKMPDQIEAEEWKRKILAEAARIEALVALQPQEPEA